MKVHRQKSDQICKTGLTINFKEPKEIQTRVDSLQSHWNTLNTLSQLRTKQLQDAAEAYQVRIQTFFTWIVIFKCFNIFSFMLTQMKLNHGCMKD